MKRSKITIIIAYAIFCIILASFTFAQAIEPGSPTNVTTGPSERFNISLFPTQYANAQAGNVTELTILGESVTQSWTGFYGNITGSISLEDASGNIFYNWSNAEPQGEIYASNTSTVTWAQIRCFNYSDNAGPNTSLIESSFGIADTDVEGLNETFGNGTLPNGLAYSVDGGADHPAITVGIVNIASGSCPATTTHRQTTGGINTRDGKDFVEVILTDSDSIVFTTIIENNLVDNSTGILGFDGRDHDFQMLVLDNGHLGDINPTPWYFFVELE